MCHTTLHHSTLRHTVANLRSASHHTTFIVCRTYRKELHHLHQFFSKRAWHTCEVKDCLFCVFLGRFVSAIPNERTRVNIKQNQKKIRTYVLHTNTYLLTYLHEFTNLETDRQTDRQTYVRTCERIGRVLN